MSSHWTVTTLNRTVDAELDALPADMRARLVRIAELIRSGGLENVGLPHVRPVQPPLWEIQLSGRAGIARALYVTAHGKRVVILRAFVKKTPNTPRQEIYLALERARQLDSRCR
ncbi:MAG: type II toxin-antitoxin system RelE/ParE family toxin [Gammaproteobacteria bacterium]